MALNDNNNSNKIYDPTYYAKTYATNYDTNKTINVTFSGGLMKVAIANKLPNTAKTEDIISASLTGLKARLLVEAMDQMEKEIEAGTAEGKSYGVSVGMGDVVKVIAFENHDDVKHLVIAKVDAAGNVSDKTVFEFGKSNYFMSWDNFDTMKYNRNYDINIDYDMIKNALTDFSRNICGAAAYGGLYMSRFENHKDRTKIDTIMDKLGITVRHSQQPYRSENNFFNNNNNSISNSYGNGGNKNSEHKTLEDIDAMFGGGDED